MTTPDIQPLEAVINEDPHHAPVPYWFATKAGWFSNVPTLYGTAHVPATKTPATLPDIKKSFVFSNEKVPAFIFDQFLDLARKVYEKHKTEVTSYICRDGEGQYSLFIPHQYVTGASVNHKVDPGEMDDRQPVGTIHSHCMMSAFHSGTDDHDMGKMPGVHITVGMVLNDQPEYAIALAVGNTRFDIEPWDIIDEDVTEDKNGFYTAPDHWLNFIHPNQSAPWTTGGVKTTYKQKWQKGKFQPGPWNSGWADGWMGDGFDYPGLTPGVQTYQQPHGLPMSEAILDEEAIVLAQQGFRLQYTITRDPEGAKAWLAKRDDGLTDPMFPLTEVEGTPSNE